MENQLAFCDDGSSKNGETAIFVFSGHFESWGAGCHRQQANDSPQDALEFEYRIGFQIYNKLGGLIFLTLLEIPWLQISQHNNITL